MPSEDQQALRLRLVYFMRSLLLALLFIPFFTSSSWADPEKPSGNFTFEDRRVLVGDYDSNEDNNDFGSVFDNQREKQSVKQGQQRQSGWRQINQ